MFRLHDEHNQDYKTAAAHTPPRHTEIVKIRITLYAYENCKPSGIPNAQKQIVANQGS